MRQTVLSLWKNDFIKGSAILTSTTFAANILNYFFNWLTARALGPVGFGEISAMLSYTVILSIPMSVMSLVVINKIGSKGEHANRFAAALQEWFYSKAMRWRMFAVLLIALIPFVPFLTNLSPIVGYALVPYVILIFAVAFYSSILQGLLLFFWASLVSILTAFLKLTGGALVIAGVDGLGTVVTFMILSGVIPLVVAHFILKYQVAHKVRMSERLEKRLTHAIFNRYVILTFLSILAITLFNNVDVIFVKKFFNSQDAGFYSAWSLCAKIILYVTGPLSLVSFIFFSDKSGAKNSDKILQYSFAVLILIGLGSYIAYRYTPDLIINVLFGSKFMSITPYLGAASIFGTAYTTVTFINNYFLAKNSRLSLMLLPLMPVYFFLLYATPRSLNAIITLNIYFSLGVLVLYLVAYGQSIFYNGVNGKKKD